MPTRKRRNARGTALLLIDFINRLDFPGARTLAPRALRAAAHAAELRRRAHEANVPCIYLNDHYGAWASPFGEVLQSVAAANRSAARLVSQLAPEPGDITILKPRHSGFYGTPLEFLLEELRTRRLIITGIATDNCVFATAQDAHVRKFELWIPANCVAAEAGSGEAAVLRHMERTLKARTTPAAGQRLWP